MKCLVTGGAGFIGSHLVYSLLEKGNRVKVIDNFSTGKIENLKELINDIELIKGDITDNKSINDAIKDVDVVFHQAAVPSVPRSIKDPIKTNSANVTGTLKLLNAAVHHRVSRFIYAASSSAYGNTEILPKEENMSPNPLSPYAVSKYAGELYCKVFNTIYGLETLSLRYFNVFGPRQDPESQYAAVIPKFIMNMLKNQSPIIYGDGNQSRDFTYIDNVVLANLLAAEAPKLSGEVVNVGTGTNIKINQLVLNINKLLNTEISPIYANCREGDVKHSLASIERINRLLGYKPIISFEEGLKKTIVSMK